MIKRILRLIAMAAILIAVGLGAVTLWLRGSLPQTDGALNIAGLDAAVEILRDDDGMVTIRAETDHDAYLALGYAHAQDRLWQMDFMRRTGAGRLSEVTGPATLPIDRFMRTLGLYRVAQANFNTLSPEARAAVEAYTVGVNAFIEEPDGPLPLEFHLLRYKPEPWQPADSIVWGKLMALQLSNNWNDEILRARLSKRLSAKQIDFLWPDHSNGATTITADAAKATAPSDAPALRDLGQILPWRLAPKDASNAWTVDGTLTAQGKPILANDPHLALESPGIWYLVRIETPTLTLAGATAPGVPFLIAGHNKYIAWGFSTTHGDTQDLFIERLAADTPDSYQTAEGPWSFDSRQETIMVHGQESVTLQVRTTRHGPVVSDVMADADDTLTEGTVLALAWPALQDDDRTPEALFRINRAKDWKAFREASKNFHSPQQNIVFADTAGTIAFVAPARVPLRKRGNGRAPVPGWTGEYDWNGFIPFEQLPVLRNPPQGRIVTANQKVVPTSYPHLITANWPSPGRAKRIAELLDSKPRISVEDAQDIQQDIQSAGAGDLLPLLLKLDTADERLIEAVDSLRSWDGRMARDQAGPLLYTAWTGALTRLLLADELGPDFIRFQRPKPDLLRAILTEDQLWCDDITTSEVEDCNDQLGAALKAALNQLSFRFKRIPSRLRWGDAHVARFTHPVLSRIPVLRSLFSFEVETDGGDTTINRAGVNFSGPEKRLYEDVHGPGFRAVYDLADLDNSRFMIATGQSGNPLSPHYGDLAERWRDGFYIKLVGVDKATQNRLILNPASPSR